MAERCHERSVVRQLRKADEARVTPLTAESVEGVERDHKLRTVADGG